MTVPVQPQDKSSEWWLIVFPIIAGLLALFCFLSLGGLFAIVAPWVILGAIQSATKRTGWQILGMITGITFIGMGIAALLLAHASSTRSVAGVMGLIFGVWYIGITLWEMVKKRLNASRELHSLTAVSQDVEPPGRMQAARQLRRAA